MQILDVAVETQIWVEKMQGAAKAQSQKPSMKLNIQLILSPFAGEQVAP